MARRITIIQGHPDPAGGHFCHALAQSYADGAREGGHEIHNIQVARLEFPLLQTKPEWESGQPPESIRQAQQAISSGDHLVIIYPLWLGTMPAILKGFLEQVLRPGFAISINASGSGWNKQLQGKSARIVITMGMPALAYRWFFRAHGLKNLERNILHFCGIRPVRETLIGMIESMNDRRRQKWLAKLHALGRKGI